MKVNVRYFASIREAVGQGSESLQTDAATLGALREQLLARGGAWSEALARGRAVRMALDQVMSDESAALAEGSGLRLLRPGQRVKVLAGK